VTESARRRVLPATIAQPVVNELIINRSRFIATAFPVDSVAAADAIITDIRKEHWTANHNCTALIVGELGETQRSSDDGEPAGTAGVPMLEVLRRRQLTDVLVVVTRYFGGVLLGAGGLVRAYSGAVAAVLDDATLLHRRLLTEIQVSVDYGQAGRLENALRTWLQSNDAVLGAPRYTEIATFPVLIPYDAAAQLAEVVMAATSGSAQLTTGPEQLVTVPG